MRQILGVLLLLGCAAQPKTGRPYKDAPILVGVATGTVGATQVAAAAVVTVAVGAAGIPPLRQVPDGSGVADHTRATCQEICRHYEYNGFDCSGDKGKITWFRQ